LEDYIEKDGIKYYVLRIPYSIIDELHKKNFKLLEQPLSADISEVNKVMEQVGFDFIYAPVMCNSKTCISRKGDHKSMMLLPSFNFIGEKEIMKLLRNFHLAQVKQNFFLIFAGGGLFMDLKIKRVIINKRNNEVII
jgi:hypothetical protein